MAFKLLHLADLHLDSPLGWLKDSQKRNLRHSERMATLKKALSLAEEKEAHAVLIAGDLLEQRNFRLDTVNYVRKIFEGSPLPILVVAGNHDPLVEESPYLTLPWPKNVHIFKGREFKPFEPLSGLVVHGASHVNFLEGTRPLSWLKIPQDGRVHVVLFHGSYTGWRPLDPFSTDSCFLFSIKELKEKKAHYFALGHYHSFRDFSQEGIPACYPGSPEAVSMDERGERFVVLVEVGEEGPPKMEAIPVGARKVKRVEVDCSDAESGEEILNRLRGEVFDPSVEGEMMELVLTGEVEPEVEANPEWMEGVLTEEVRKGGGGPFFLRVRSEIRPKHDIGQIKEEVSVRGEFVRLMLEKVKGAEKEEEARRLERAMFYGLDAFSKREVRKR